MTQGIGTGLGGIIKERRHSLSISLDKLSRKSGVSPSHIVRIERGERFPSARVLRKLAEPLGFGEEDLFRIAGYLSVTSGGTPEPNSGPKLDRCVAEMLAQEPLEIQRAAVAILQLLKRLRQYVNTG